jgi:archaellum component FlaC
MSDKELVTIDPGQFNALDSKIGALGAELQIIRERLGPVDKDKSLHQVLTHIERTLFDGFKLLAAGTNGGSNSEVLKAINNLDRKVDEFMSTQEERLQGVNTALTSIADGINTLQQQVADLKANNPALDDEISAIEGTVKAIADDINGVVPDTGGGETGGGGEPGISGRRTR